MNNYMKSEHYRLRRKKSLYLVTTICYFLILTAAIVLYAFDKIEANFPYGTNTFFYATLIGSGFLILIIAILVNFTLTGKDRQLIKQSIAFGISRNTIFWTKLILTLSYFLVISLIGLMLMIALGETILVQDGNLLKSFMIASVNMLPVVLSCFVLVHVMKMLNLSDTYIFITVTFIYLFSGDILYGMSKMVPIFDNVYQYAPNKQLDSNLFEFMNGTVQIEESYWLTALVIITISLAVGIRLFGKKEFH